MQIMEAVALLISSLPESERRASLNSMLQPVVQSLQQTLQMQQKMQGNGTASPAASPRPPTQVLALFDRLTAILRYSSCGRILQVLFVMTITWTACTDVNRIHMWSPW